MKVIQKKKYNALEGSPCSYCRLQMQSLLLEDNIEAKSLSRIRVVMYTTESAAPGILDPCNTSKSSRCSFPLLEMGLNILARLQCCI